MSPSNTLTPALSQGRGRAFRGLLLAGGASTRFGAPKLLHPWEGGLTLGEVAARNLVAGVGNALAVVRAGDEELAARLRAAGCEVLLTERCREGMGASLAAGVAASSDAAAWIVALADMPRIPAIAYQAVVKALEGGALLAAPVTRQGVRGHPVGFAAALAEELRSLSGDEGAKAIVDRHRARLAAVTLDADEILFDVDRPEAAGPRSRRP